jgi:predicted esterase
LFIYISHYYRYTDILYTQNMGMRMPGWYDIKSFSDLAAREEDEEGILRSRDYLHTLIDAEVAKGIPASRVVVGGFSQGGALSLIAGLTYKQPLGGVFGLSCYLLLQGKIKELIPEHSPNQKTPIFMGHGDADPVVAHKYGKKSAEVLEKMGYNVDFRTYRDLVHSADPEEIDHLESYLTQQIPALGDDKNTEGSL